MTKYSKCGHITNGVIILDDNVLGYANYFEWAESVGLYGTKEMCFECWCDKRNEEIKKLQKEKGK